MTRPVESDVDRILDTFLETGPDRLSERVASAIRTDVHRVGRRRVLPWERTTNLFAVVGSGLALVVAIAALAVALSRPSDVGGPGPGGTPGPSALPTVGSSPSATRLAPLGYEAPGTIVFTRADPANDIGDTTWLINPDGTGEQQFPPGTQGVCCAVFSHDGSRVAIGTAGPDGSYMSTIFDLSGDYVQEDPIDCASFQSRDGIRYVPRAWSPDDALVALETWSDTDPTRNGIALAPEGRGACAIQIAGAHDDVPIAFSPDGTRLLFVRITDGEQGTLMELTVPDVSLTSDQAITGSVREVGVPGMLVTVNDYFGAPASWSPDGKQIAFAATDPSLPNGNMRIWVIDADGGDPVSLTADRAVYTGAEWSPDGRRIAFDRDNGSGWHDLFVVEPDGSGETNLTESFTPGVCCARWSPDSSALLVAGTVSDNEESYLFIVPVDGSPIAQVTTLPGWLTSYSWGPASR